jgi:hypothetical protein
VTSPSGGETWLVGDTASISWTSTNLSEENLKIELNRSYPGPTWETIVDSTANDASYAWTVSGPPTTTARIRITGVTHTTVGDTSDGDFAIEPCDPPFEIIGALPDHEYYTSWETVNCNVSTRNNCGPATEVLLTVYTFSVGVDGFSVPFPRGGSTFMLEPGPQSHTASFSWAYDLVTIPRGVTILSILTRVSDGAILAQESSYNAYVVGAMSRETWQGMLEWIENCSEDPGVACFSAAVPSVIGSNVPYVSLPLQFYRFENSMCVTRRLALEGRVFEGTLYFVDGWLGGFAALASLSGLPISAGYSAMRAVVICARQLLDVHWPWQRDMAETDPALLAHYLTQLPDSTSDFSNHLIVHGNGSLEVAINDTQESNLDHVDIKDGFVIDFPSKSLLWAYLGPEAIPAGDTLATNLHHVGVFQYVTFQAETASVALVHRMMDSSIVMADWALCIFDSAGGFRIPVSDTTDCIKMFMDQDGDGVFEQTVYPEVGEASMQLVAMVDGDSIRLSWNPVYCASSYRVFWGSSLDEITTQLMETADTTCADATLHSVRFYHVTAVFP